MAESRAGLRDVRSRTQAHAARVISFKPPGALGRHAPAREERVAHKVVRRVAHSHRLARERREGMQAQVAVVHLPWQQRRQPSEHVAVIDHVGWRSVTAQGSEIGRVPLAHLGEDGHRPSAQAPVFVQGDRGLEHVRRVGCELGVEEGRVEDGHGGEAGARARVEGEGDARVRGRRRRVRGWERGAESLRWHGAGGASAGRRRRLRVRARSGLLPGCVLLSDAARVGCGAHASAGAHGRTAQPLARTLDAALALRHGARGRGAAAPAALLGAAQEELVHLQGAQHLAPELVGGVAVHRSELALRPRRAKHH
mmetsp:Transcript_23478/g.73139  ORF Transcript_23478/g.73139 Transcript_23478/m.73139 type:complete len:311 (+) Transcript_23478:125-1057(+)